MARKRKQIFKIMIFNQSDNELLHGMLTYFHAGNTGSAKDEAEKLADKLGNKSTLIAIQNCKVDRYKNVQTGKDVTL